VILSFRDTETEDIYNGKESKAARRRLPVEIWRIAQRKLDYIRAAKQLKDLGSPPANELERLKDDRAGQHSIRINRQYRVCFEWTDNGAENVEITDYH